MRFISSLCALFMLFSASAMAQTPEAVDDGTTKEQLYSVLESDFVEGDENAPVTIVEYASMSCSHCASFHKSVYPPLKENYIDTGKVKFIFRDFPLDAQSLSASMLVRCVEEEKYKKFIDVLFRTQSNWAGRKNYLEVLENIAKLGGVSGEQFNACMDDKDLELSVVQSKFNASQKLQVRSTPTLYINGKEIVGSRTYEAVAKEVDAVLMAATTSKPEAVIEMETKVEVAIEEALETKELQEDNVPASESKAPSEAELPTENGSDKAQ